MKTDPIGGLLVPGGGAGSASEVAVAEAVGLRQKRSRPGARMAARGGAWPTQVRADGSSRRVSSSLGREGGRQEPAGPDPHPSSGRLL